jgi:hypothetical protein
MRVNVMTFRGLSGEQFLHDIEQRVQTDLVRFGGRISQVEVLLMDDEERADDKSCIIEARMSGLAPIAVQAHAHSFEKAVDKGAEKIEEMITIRDHDQASHA